MKLLEKLIGNHSHPQDRVLKNILMGKTEISSSGYPYIAEGDFTSFISAVPHLFSNGNALLDWLEPLEKAAANETASEEVDSLKRSIKVLKNVVLTASITSPTDLWLIRQIISTHKKLGIIGYLLSGASIDVAKFSKEKSLDEDQLEADFAFLNSRGYLQEENGSYRIAPVDYAKTIFTELAQLSDKCLESNWFQIFQNIFNGKSTSEEKTDTTELLAFSAVKPNLRGWHANVAEVEMGFRIVPIILALRSLDKLAAYKQGDGFGAGDKDFTGKEQIMPLLKQACYIDSNENVTSLGARVFTRGSGPFGIIYTYHSYLKHHDDLLHGKEVSSWVSRGENVAASQDANKKTFEMANNALDQFCEKHNFSYDVYIEHAVGQGEATRQRLEKSGESSIQYFGADLEDAAIDRAIEFQQKGVLPKNMKFIRNADIGKPNILVDEIRNLDSKTEQSVMIVGNGFHEVRGQTNERMIQVFGDYCQAGIVLLFTEESGLMDEDLLSTAWNTYHAGFRYVHAISGQGLRPSLDKETSKNYSWSKCATLGGYQVLADYTTRTRTIYPHPRKDGYNPAISVNYFCVPRSLATDLGFSDK